MSNKASFTFATVFITSLLGAGCGDDAQGTQDTGAPDTQDTATTPEATPTDTESPGVDTEPPPPCSSVQCESGIASDCEGTLTLDCGLFQAQCVSFQGRAGLDAWCGCGRLAEGSSTCLTGTSGVSCEEGLGIPFECIDGAACQDIGGNAECVCNNQQDGICPDASCTEDPDCNSCTPSCSGRDCGDNGCGGTCGNCGLGKICQSGNCVCAPSCSDRQCGDDGCGGSCGSCPGSESCDQGQCVLNPPTDLLNGKVLRVLAFTVSNSHVYFVALGSDARHHTYRCPIGGCAETPQELSSGAFPGPALPDIELAGTEVFWVQGDDTIWRADIGSNAPGAARQAYNGLGATIEGLRSDGDNLFAAARNIASSDGRLWVQIPGNGGSSSADTSTLSMLPARGNLSRTVFDVGPGAITVWAGSVNQPTPIYSIGVGGTEPVTSNFTAIPVDGLVRFGSQIAWVDNSQTPNRLLSCGVGIDCDNPYEVATGVGPQITSDGDGLVFTQVEGGTGHVKVCSGLDLLINNCIPETISSGFDWVGADGLRVRSGFVYGINQMGIRLVRSPL